MPANSSSARKARRSNGAGHVESQAYQCPAQATREAVVAPVRRRSPASVGVPLLEAHLRAGHRRYEGRDAGVRFVAGKGNAREDRRQYRRRQGRRQIAGGARGEERRQGSGVRSRQLSLSRPRQGAGRCGTRERAELLEHDPEQRLAVFRKRSCAKRNWFGRIRGQRLKPPGDWKTPWQVNANAADANGAGIARSATASSSTSSSTSTVWRRWSRAASASALRRWW